MTGNLAGQRGIEISNKLSAEGRYVIGWDLEWAMDFSQNKDRNQVTTNLFRRGRL